MPRRARPGGPGQQGDFLPQPEDLRAGLVRRAARLGGDLDGAAGQRRPAARGRRVRQAAQPLPHRARHGLGGTSLARGGLPRLGAEGGLSVGSVRTLHLRAEHCGDHAIRSGVLLGGVGDGLWAVLRVE